MNKVKYISKKKNNILWIEILFYFILHFLKIGDSGDLGEPGDKGFQGPIGVKGFAGQKGTFDQC